MRPWLPALITALALASAPVAAQSPAPAEGPELAPRAPATDSDLIPGELSRQGTRRGALEFGIGALLIATAGTLIAAGVVEFGRAREQALFCEQREVIIITIGEGENSGGIDPCTFNPPPLGFAAAGLSWGFSLPLLVGAGLLLTRGLRVHRDARAYKQWAGAKGMLSRLQLRPWWRGRASARAGGLSLSLRY